VSVLVPTFEMQFSVQIIKDRLDTEVRSLVEKAAKEQALRPQKLEIEGNGTERGVSSSKSTTGADKNFEEDDVMPGKNQKKKRGSQHSVKERIVDDADEDVKGRASKSKKKGGRSKGGISLLAGDTGTGASKTGQGSTTKEDSDVPSLELLIEKILEWYPDMDSAGIGESGREYFRDASHNSSVSLVDLRRSLITA
jgi:hypothetical protein